MSVKHNLLYLLEQNKGSPLSGEAIAKELLVSRAAVWKAVKELTSQGYDITTIKSKGYVLNITSDILSNQAVKLYLDNKDVQIIVRECISSTNMLARELATSGAAHGSVVVASEQTEGRGRLGRRFISPKDTGLYLTVILRNNHKIQNALMVTTAAAVAVCRAIDKLYDIDLQIKWVNDLYINNKKCGGILCEAVSDIQTGMSEYILVGIGLNLLSPRDGFDESIKEIADSLFTENIQPQRAKLTAMIVNELIKIENTDFMEEYVRRNIVIGKEIGVLQGDKEEIATAIGINDDGTLEVKYKNGETSRLSYGEVSIRM